MSFLTAVFNAPVKSLLDSMVMDHTDPGSYGQLRLFGQLGFGFGSSVVGLVLANSKHVAWPAKSTLSDAMLLRFEQWHLAAVAVLVNKAWQSLTSYKLLFVAHAVLSVPTWMAIRAFQRLNLNSTTGSHRPNATVTALSKSKRQSKKVAATNNNNNNNNNNIQKGLSLLLHNADALLFFFLVFVVGVSSGVVENFAYVRMREVGGTGKAMGLSRLVSSLAGAPMFWYSGPLTEALGADRVILLSLTSYALRFLIYAFMRNPYHGLPAEALRGVTFAAFWSTSTIYAHRVSPPGLHATMLMFLNAMYGGLGQSLGAIIGGKMQHKFGTVITFLYAAAFDLMFVAMLVAYLSLRKDSSFKNPKPIVAHTSYE
jgi:predicted MFS family arabinose efflux permease